MHEHEFHKLYEHICDARPGIQGAALVSNDGLVLFQKGATVAHDHLIGAAGAAIIQLSEHINAGLSECNTQDITIRCQKHSAFFSPLDEHTIIMLVLLKDTDTRSFRHVVDSCMGKK